jgi:uncharacterized membrane protein
MTTAVDAGQIPKPAWRASRTLWLIAILSFAFGLYGLSYLVGRPAPPGPATNAARYPWLAIHAVCAGAALLIGPWQFFAPIRRRWPALHRWMGRSYVTLCAIAGSVGLFLAWNASSGDVARSGFFVLAIVWLGCTGMAYTRALRRDFIAHRAWMTRSFALTFAAVTLRAYLPLSAVPHLSFQMIYPWTAWASWIPNLAIAEWWLRSGGRLRI